MADTITATQSPYELKRWLRFKQSDKHAERFVYFLAPIMEHVYQQGCLQIAHSKNLAAIITDNTLLAILTEQFKSLFTPMVLKCCLWELHVSKERGALDAYTPEKRFLHYIESMTHHNFIRYFLDKYPPLKQAIDNRVATLLHNWQQFLSRLDEDFPQLNETLLKLGPCQVKNIHAEGDTHCLGQHVMRIEFCTQQNEKKDLIYKPRDLRIDLAYTKLIHWLNQHTTLKQKTFELINRQEYGWCEFIDYQSCDSTHAIERFYQRQGALLAVLYCINGNDIHYENVIAHGEYPIIIDLECLVKPDIQTQSFMQPGSVFDTHLLPQRIDIEGELEGWEIGGVNGKGQGKAINAGLDFEAAGTENMILKRVDIETTKGAHNIPMLDNQPYDNDAIACHNLLLGFTNCYQVFLKQKQFLCDDPKSPLHYFKNGSTRFLFRATRTYGILLKESFHPTIMQSDAAWDAHFAWLDTAAEEEPHYANILESEKQDFKYGDIPFFSYDPKTNCIYNGHGEKINLKINLSGLQNVKRRLHALNDADLQVQQHIIKSSYAIHRMNARMNSINQPTQSKPLPELRMTTYSDITSHALKHTQIILDKIQKLATSHHDYLTWPCSSIQSVNSQSLYTINLADHTLLTGSLGIALCFAATACFTQLDAYRDLVRRYIVTLERHYEQKKSLASLSIADRAQLSYSLQLMSQFSVSIPEVLHTRSLRDVDQLIETATEFDFIGGHAGLMCVTQDNALLNKLVTHFLEHYPDPSVAPATTQIHTINGVSTVGFAHGVAGINTALARANRHINNPQVTTWIQRSLDYLDACYDNYHYWPDMRTEACTKGPLWCHGCAGVGEGYLQLLDTHPTQQVERGLQRAIEQLKIACDDFSIDKVNHYCCGYLGAHNFLINAHKKRPDLVTAGHLQHETNRLLSCLDQFGYASFSVEGEALNLSLLYGLAGLAYHLMRIANPAQLPCILTCQLTA